MSTSTLKTKGHRFEVMRSKFSKSTTVKLFKVVQLINWSAPNSEICEQLSEMTKQDLGDRYIWMFGENPAYFLQYQIDSYAIMKGRGRVVFVWKPKYIQFPNVTKPIDFGAQPKIIKSMNIEVLESVKDTQNRYETHLKDFLLKFYGAKYFTMSEDEFETELMKELKNIISRLSTTSYWHCGIDDHSCLGVSSKIGPYLKFRVKGVKEKYDKDIIVFSHQGKRDFILKGKSMHILSFIAMLIIFLAVISCGEDNNEGMCIYKNQMLIGGAAIMMGMMGMRMANRNKNKKSIEAKIKRLENQKAQEG